MEPGGRNTHSLVFQTGRPARIDDYTDATGKEAHIARKYGCRTVVGVPIHLEGQLWGGIFVASGEESLLPADTDAWLADFAELMATAIANAQARLELRGYAEEQAALRRVAMLVARAAPPQEVFTAVAGEVGRLLDIDYTVLSRYDGDRAFEVLADWSRDPGHEPGWVGTRFELGGRNMPTLVFETARPARIDDYSEISGPVSEPVRVRGFRSGVGAPISVGAGLWGVMVAASTAEEPLPTGIEARLAAFTELVATALANAEAQAALTASRARIVAAADAARRRIERDLHDGAQQRLVSLALRAAVGAGGRAARGRRSDRPSSMRWPRGWPMPWTNCASSRGHSPGGLAEGASAGAADQLARRSAVPVQLDIRVDGRLPEHVELAAYYVVAEALTNIAKHAHATRRRRRRRRPRALLRVSVRDDGRGGADLRAARASPASRTGSRHSAAGCRCTARSGAGPR